MSKKLKIHRRGSHPEIVFGLLRRGVTLVELVIALTLSSLLLVALTGVLKTLSKQAKHSAQSRSIDNNHAIEAVLWHDLSQARGVALTNGTLWMLVPGTSPQTASGTGVSQSGNNQLIQSQSPVSQTHVIAYQLVPIDKTSFALVRKTITGSALNGTQIMQQTLAWDIEKTAFERIDDQGNPQPLPRDLGPTPLALAYRISYIGENQSHTSKVFAR